MGVALVPLGESAKNVDAGTNGTELQQKGDSSIYAYVAFAGHYKELALGCRLLQYSHAESLAVGLSNLDNVVTTKLRPFATAPSWSQCSVVIAWSCLRHISSTFSNSLNRTLPDRELALKSTRVLSGISPRGSRQFVHSKRVSFTPLPDSGMSEILNSARHEAVPFDHTNGTKPPLTISARSDLQAYPYAVAVIDAEPGTHH